MPPTKLNPWELAQEQLQHILDDHSFKNWFAQTRFESCENGRLVVGVPSEFFANWLNDHYLDVISDAVREVIPDFREIRFVVVSEPFAEPSDGGAPLAEEGDSASCAPSKGSMPARTTSRRKAAQARQSFNGFSWRYTFDRFVVGAGNRFAHAAAKAVAHSPGRAYNPLFLHGGTGLGKTHLMQAAGREIVERDPEANVVFISSEDFTNQLIVSIANKSTQRFRAKFRKADVLLIDDVHFIGGKEATQEEFFHTFNTLFDMHKQIVISSDRGPKEIQGLESRLVSRFEWGLITDIQPPDLETRVAILQNKAAEEAVVVPPEVIRYIAAHVTSNIRELEGALVTVMAYSQLTGHKTNLPMAEDVLLDLIGRERVRPVTIGAIQRAVAEHFDVRIADLCGRSRQRAIAFPRQIAMYLCKTLIPSLSLNETGEAFGGKDHTTVIYACKKVAGEAQRDAGTRHTLARLEKTLRS